MTPSASKGDLDVFENIVRVPVPAVGLIRPEDQEEGHEVTWESSSSQEKSQRHNQTVFPGSWDPCLRGGTDPLSAPPKVPGSPNQPPGFLNPTGPVKTFLKEERWSFGSR